MGREARIRQRFGLVRPDGRPLSRPPKVALGYSYGTLHGPFVHSILRLMQSPHGAVIRHLIPQQGLYIGENRNEVVKRFLATEADWLLQIDTDIAFPPGLPAQLVDLAGERKILAASVPLGPPIPSCAMNRNPDMPGEWRYVPEAEITEAGIECDVVATAVVLIHREVFEAIAEREGQAWFLQTGPGAILPDVRDPSSRVAWYGDGPMRDRKYIHVGEDVLFCMRAEDAGYRSHCVKVPGLRHYKVIPLSHDDVVVPAEMQEASR